jgi:protein pelota
MRLLKKRISHKGIGFIHLIPTEEDDFWYIYNLLSVGDIIKTSTFRKIVREGKFSLKCK